MDYNESYECLVTGLGRFNSWGNVYGWIDRTNGWSYSQLNLLTWTWFRGERDMTNNKQRNHFKRCYLFVWLDSVRRAALSSMAGLCHKSDLLQRAYLKWARHGAKHCWLEGVGKRDDRRYLKNRKLSNDDDDSSENVAKKLNLPRFKCYRVYLELLNLSNVGDFSWSWILKNFIQDQKEKGEFVVVCSLSL